MSFGFKVLVSGQMFPTLLYSGRIFIDPSSKNRGNSLKGAVLLGKAKVYNSCVKKTGVSRNF
ncbi:hypothetical protein [Ferruginibacter sp.]